MVRSRLQPGDRRTLRNHVLVAGTGETAVLLGAGASAEAGVPTTFEMTERLTERINARQYDQRPTAAALHFVCGALLAYDGAEGRNPFSGLDVERVFAAVELLAERNTLEVSPFVASWHRAVDALDTRSSTMDGSFNRRFAQALAQPHSFGGARELLVGLIDARTGSAADGKTYRDLATAMVDELRRMVATTAKQTAYLEPLARCAERDGGLTVATLNYDLSLEQAASSAQVPCSTGIGSWLDTGRWDWPDEGLRLLKLHGSIDWEWADVEYADGHLPRRALRVVDASNEHQGQPALVFGQRGKLRAEGPFLGLLAQMEALMSSAERLVVIGYSFRDDHVNELIQRWCQEDIARVILVVDPNWPEIPKPSGYPTSDFRTTLENYLVPWAEGEEQTFERRLFVQRERCSQALPSIFGTPVPDFMTAFE
jgi:hypothetical protein